MKRSTVCKNCSTENPIFRFNCSNCNYILHNRVVNIDFWQTAWQLLESPQKAFLHIIQSEHKNYLIFLVLLASLNFWFDSIVLKNLLSGPEDLPLVSSFFSALIGSIFYLIFISVSVTGLNKLFNIKSRWKDNFSIYIYSLLPQLILLPILFTIEFAVFGQYWLIYNPSPFLLKPAIAYVLLILEAILFIYSAFLLVISTYVQTGLRLYSVVAAIFIAAGMIYLMILI